MEVVNNRYKIVRELKYSTNDVSAFVALDLYHKNKLVSLSMLKSEKLSDFSKDFINRKFIQISSMPNNLFFANYDFNVATVEIDQRPQKLFYFTYELPENYVPLVEYLESFSIEEILFTIIQICQCQNLAILNGYMYPINSLDNFYLSIAGNTDDIKIKAQDLITIAINEKKPLHKYQFESIADLFLSLFNGYSSSRNFFDNVQNIRKYYTNLRLNDYQTKVLNCILEVCENICSGRYGGAIFDFYYLLVADINKKLNSFFTVDDNDVKSYFCTQPKLQTQEKLLQNIIDNINRKQQKENYNIFLITGNLGSAKTKLLVNLSFSLMFEDVDSYFFEAGDKSNIFFVQILSSMIDKFPSLKNEVDLNNIYLQTKVSNLKSNSALDNKYNLISKINDIIKKATSVRPQVIIVDNFNFVDKFTLEFIFSNMVQGLSSSRLYFVFSFTKDFKNYPKYFKTAYETIRKNKTCVEISLKPLTQLETANLVKDILLMRDAPILTAKEINKITGGNPHFTIELLKEVVGSAKFWKNKDDGYWIVEDNIYNTFSFFEASKSIVSLAQNTFNKYFKPEYKTIKAISIFHNYLKKSFIKKLISDIDDAKADEVFSELLENNFISNVKDDIFRIDEKILQSSLYSLLTDSQKKDLHSKALEILKHETDELFFDEIIFHYDYLGHVVETLDLLIKKASLEKNKGNFYDAIASYERAMVILIKQNVSSDKKVSVAAELASVYYEITEINYALQTISGVKELLPNVENKKIALKYYLIYCELLYEAYDINNLNLEFDNLKKIKNEISNLSKEENQAIKKIVTLYNMLKGDYLTAENNIKELISEIEEFDTNDKRLADIYRILGLIKYRKGEYKTAHHFSSLGYKLANKYNNIRQMLRNLGNIAGIAFLKGNNFELVEETYLKTLKIAEEYGFEQTTLQTLINLAVFYTHITDLNLVEHYLNHANQKLLIITNHSINLQLYSPYLGYLLLIQKYQYVKAIAAKKNFETLLKENKNNAWVKQLGLNIGLIDAEVNLNFGEYDEYIQNTELAKNATPDIFRKIIRDFEIELVEILSKKKKSNFKLKQSFMHLCKKLPDNYLRDLLNSSISILFISIAQGRFDLFKNISHTIVEKCGNIFDGSVIPYVKLKIIEAIINEDFSESTWITLLAKIKEQDVLFIEILLKRLLARSYYANKKYAQGILTFIDVEQLILKLLQQVPNEKRLSFFNLYSFGVPFKIVFNFIKNGITEIDYSVFLEKVSDLGLKKLYNSNDLKLLIKNKDFLDTLLTEIFSGTNWILKHRTLSKTLENFTSDNKNNIHLLINLMMQKLFSNYSNIIITDKTGHEQFMFNIDSQNVSFFEYMKTLQNGGINELRKIFDELNAELISLSLPNDNDDKKYTLIFAVQKQVAILSRHRIKYCKKLLPLLYTLIKSYNLDRVLTKEETSGASNIPYFQKVLNSCVDYSSNKKVAISICYFRIENLKAIRTFHGQDFTKFVIKQIVELIYANIQATDVVTRYTMDEFAILFYDTDKNNAIYKIETIKKRLDVLNFAELSLPLSLTAGIANIGEEGTTAKNIVDKAHIAMLYASTLGINKTSIYYHSLENYVNIIPSTSELYKKNINYTSEVVNIFFDLLFTSSAYASKNAMLNEFLYKLVDYMKVKTASLILFDKDSDTMETKDENIITVGEAPNINWHYVKRAKETLTGFFIDEVELQNIGELNFPIWYSVLVYPLVDSEFVKGAFYLTAESGQKYFTNDDLGFMHLIALLLEKEL